MKSATDRAQLGEYDVEFQVFISELDPSALYSWPLGFTLTVKIQDLVVEIVESDLLGNIAGSLAREAPVSIENIAPIYFGFFKEQSEYQFDFADPLAVTLSKGEEGVITGLKPSGIQIKVVSSDLPFI